MTEVKTKNPKKIIIGETYMINYIGWKKIKVIDIKEKNITVQEHDGKGIQHIVTSDRIKVNLIK